MLTEELRELGVRLRVLLHEQAGYLPARPRPNLLAELRALAQEVDRLTDEVEEMERVGRLTPTGGEQ